MTTSAIRSESRVLESKHAYVAPAPGASGCAVCGRKEEVHPR